MAGKMGIRQEQEAGPSHSSYTSEAGSDSKKRCEAITPQSLPFCMAPTPKGSLTFSNGQGVREEGGREGEIKTKQVNRMRTNARVRPDGPDSNWRNPEVLSDSKASQLMGNQQP